MSDATLEGVYLCAERRQSLVRVESALLVAGRGLDGDRYGRGRGSFSRWPGSGRAVSLIEAEAIEAVLGETGIDLSDGRSRRNLVTRGVRLEDWVGKTFRVGAAVLRGVRPCSPCAYLERLTAPGAFAALKGRGGLRADVIVGGPIRAGDAITLSAPIASTAAPHITFP